MRLKVFIALCIVFGLSDVIQAAPVVFSREELQQAINAKDTKLVVKIAQFLAHEGREDDIKALVEEYIPYTRTPAVRQDHQYKFVNMNYMGAEKIYKPDSTDYLVGVLKNNPPDNISDSDVVEFAGRALVRIATEKSTYPLLEWAHDAPDADADLVRLWMDGPSLSSREAINTTKEYLQKNQFRSKAIKDIFIKNSADPIRTRFVPGKGFIQVPNMVNQK